MEIQGRYLLRDFSKKHPNALKPLKRWVVLTEEAQWRIPTEVKVTFPSVSFVKTTAVFNIKSFRLLSHILYEKAIVVVYNILVHEEYERLKIE